MGEIKLDGQTTGVQHVPPSPSLECWVDLDGCKGLMWHGKGLGIGKVGKAGPGRILEISCGTDSRG